VRQTHKVNPNIATVMSVPANSIDFSHGVWFSLDGFPASHKYPVA
jgi:hypothetical protein